MLIQIKINNSLYDGWSSEDLEIFDILTSNVSFCTAVGNRVQMLYPDAEIEVEIAEGLFSNEIRLQEDNGIWNFNVNGSYDWAVEEIQAMIADEYCEMEWLVKK